MGAMESAFRRRVRRLLPPLAAFVSVAIAVLSARGTLAQTPLATPTTAATVGPPTPTATQVPIQTLPPPGTGSICVSQYSGGQTVSPTLSVNATFQISLPAGGNYGIGGGIADPGGEFVRVCYVEGNSAIFFDPMGRETSRVVNSQAANAVLDQIAREIRVVPSSPATISPPLSQTPRPGPPLLASVTGCGIPSMLGAGGGETIRIAHGDRVLELVLPPSGEYGHLPAGTPRDEPMLRVCHVETDSLITISAVTGREISRQASSAAGNAILDQIAASARFRPAFVPPAPTPRPGAPAGPLRPPTTGDAGLR
jgi:hypothetical protein